MKARNSRLIALPVISMVCVLGLAREAAAAHYAENSVPNRGYAWNYKQEYIGDWCEPLRRARVDFSARWYFSSTNTASSGVQKITFSAHPVNTDLSVGKAFITDARGNEVWYSNAGGVSYAKWPANTTTTHTYTINKPIIAQGTQGIRFRVLTTPSRNCSGSWVTATFSIKAGQNPDL